MSCLNCGKSTNSDDDALCDDCQDELDSEQSFFNFGDVAELDENDYWDCDWD